MIPLPLWNWQIHHQWAKDQLPIAFGACGTLCHFQLSLSHCPPDPPDTSGSKDCVKLRHSLGEGCHQQAHGPHFAFFGCWSDLCLAWLGKPNDDMNDQILPSDVNDFGLEYIRVSIYKLSNWPSKETSLPLPPDAPPKDAPSVLCRSSTQQNSNHKLQLKNRLPCYPELHHTVHLLFSIRKT